MQILLFVDGVVLIDPDYVKEGKKGEVFEKQFKIKTRDNDVD